LGLPPPIPDFHFIDILNMEQFLGPCIVYASIGFRQLFPGYEGGVVTIGGI